MLRKIPVTVVVHFGIRRTVKELPLRPSLFQLRNKIDMHVPWPHRSVKVQIFRRAIRQPPIVVIGIELKGGSDLPEIGLALRSPALFGGSTGANPNHRQQKGQNRQSHYQFSPVEAG
jgi:hypothetical protein